MSNRPGRFGADFKDDSTTPTPAEVPSAAVEDIDLAIDNSVVAPTPIRAAAKPKAKKPAAKQTAAPAEEFIRKHVEWTEEIDFEFQDGVDAWYVLDRDRKRRLRRRPADNQFITGLVRVALKAIEDDRTVTVTLPNGQRKSCTYGELFEELMPPPRTGGSR